ncbi:hypothetical protein KUH32_04835 [Thalassococcus sp. CAU 1522]|uniref:Uncharacterized protein n=1 Tax=Thalassococcus arenae TaxID=2851652 RepID=A0ABS6N520_9RHOB|nr:hypothetical protein [Thalassococcus arenae]MBV2359093.1 hypothetical protein [Thalassococcus arenae]
MPHTKDNQPLRDELVRLLKGLDLYRAWRLSRLKRQHPGVDESALADEVVLPGSHFLHLFDTATDKNRLSVLREVRAWYAHGASDLANMARLSDETRREVDRFLDEFRETLGVGFHSQAGTLRKTADRVLKRGKVRTEDEYHLLKELEIDLSQTVLDADALERLSAMLRLFECTAQAR